MFISRLKISSETGPKYLHVHVYRYYMYLHLQNVAEPVFTPDKCHMVTVQACVIHSCR